MEKKDLELKLTDQPRARLRLVQRGMYWKDTSLEIKEEKCLMNHLKPISWKNQCTFKKKKKENGRKG